MDKIWLKSYPSGVPAEIDPNQYRSLVHLLEESFQKYADRKAFVCMDKHITFGELDVHSKRIGAWLQSRGMKPGARVALMMPNVLQYPVAIAGVLRAGYVVDLPLAHGCRSLPSGSASISPISTQSSSRIATATTRRATSS